LLVGSNPERVSISKVVRSWWSDTMKGVPVVETATLNRVVEEAVWLRR